MSAFIRSLFRTKPLDMISAQAGSLKRCLTAFDLTLLGVGAIIGAGIFVLTGIAAATKAGPGLVLSYALAALACGFSAMAYAELSASIGGCGSAYGYAFAGLGEFMAWLIGWDLLLEYGMACSAVSIGWSGYANNALAALGINLPPMLLNGPWDGGLINLPAVFIIFFITVLLSIGIRESTKFNAIVVYIKLAAIALFIGIAAFHVKPENWHPFLPFGWSGVVSGAALIFFAYIGFDAVSTAAEETINPQRDLPIGIIASLAGCAIIFMLVTALLTGAAHYTTLNVGSPIAQVLLNLGYRMGAAIVAVGAIAGLTTVILVMYYGFTRVFLAMTRDGLLPQRLASINPKTKTPITIIVFVGVIMALVAGFVPIHHVAELVNIGTLAAFAIVCVGVMIMRITKPNMARPFKIPFGFLIPSLGVIFCLYLMLNLPALTWKVFAIWTLVGLVVYFVYSRNRSILHNA